MGWIAIDFLWKLFTAVLIYPRVNTLYYWCTADRALGTYQFLLFLCELQAASVQLLSICGLFGSILHIAWTIPVSYMEWSDFEQFGFTKRTNGYMVRKQRFFRHSFGCHVNKQAAESFQLVGNILLDFLVLPYGMLYLVNAALSGTIKPDNQHQVRDEVHICLFSH
jgi:hypothetical protein